MAMVIVKSKYPNFLLPDVIVCQELVFAFIIETLLILLHVLIIKIMSVSY